MTPPPLIDITTAICTPYTAFLVADNVSALIEEN
jgi:hypothetical protein